MKKETYHVIPNSKGGWSVTKRGNERATKTFDNKESAEKFGVGLSKTHKSDLVIHKKDGSVQKRVAGTSAKSSISQKKR